MKSSFDLAAYGAHAERIVASSIDTIPGSHITTPVLRQQLRPRIDELCEGLPAISQLPSPEHVARLAPTIGGLLIELRKPPTLRDIAEYTADSAANMAEIAVHALPNGLTMFSIGTSDRLSLRQEFAPLELLIAAGLHTHSSHRAVGTEDLGVSLHAARVPSPADLEYARTIGPPAQYIADQHGITFFTAPRHEIPANVMIAHMLGSLDLNNMSDAAIESIHYPAAVATLSDTQTRSWNDIDSTLTLHDFVPHSNLHTGDMAGQDVFAAAGRS